MRLTILNPLQFSNQIYIIFIKTNQSKSNVGFWGEGKTRVPGEKTSRSRVENQQTQPTYDSESGNRTRDTLVEGEHSHHCANPAPQNHKLSVFLLYFLTLWQKLHQICFSTTFLHWCSLIQLKYWNIEIYPLKVNINKFWTEHWLLFTIIFFNYTVLHSLTGIKTTVVCLHVIVRPTKVWSIVCNNSQDFSFSRMLLPAHT